MKWRLITAGNDLWSSLKIVLVGLLLKQFIPFGLGELSGRMLTDRQTKNKEVAGAFMLVGFVQFAITVLLGFFGVFWLLSHTNYAIQQVTFVGLAVAVVLIFGVVLLKEPIVVAYERWFRSLGRISRSQISQLTLLSIARYLVFFLQSLIVFSAFNPQVSVLLLSAGISFVFLAKTVVPNIGFIGDIGVRGFSAVLFFGYFGVEAMPIILASLCIWVINIFLPSFVALFFIRRIV